MRFADPLANLNFNDCKIAKRVDNLIVSTRQHVYNCYDVAVQPKVNIALGIDDIAGQLDSISDICFQLWLGWRLLKYTSNRDCCAFPILTRFVVSPPLGRNIAWLDGCQSPFRPRTAWPTSFRAIRFTPRVGLCMTFARKAPILSPSNLTLMEKKHQTLLYPTPPTDRRAS